MGELEIQEEHSKKKQRQGQGATRRYRASLGSRADALTCFINIYWVLCRNVQWVAVKVSLVQQGRKVVLGITVNVVGLDGLLYGR